MIEASEIFKKFFFSIKGTQGNEDEPDDDDEDDDEIENSGSMSPTNEETLTTSHPTPLKRRLNPGPEQRRIIQVRQEKLNILNSIAENIAKPVVLPDKDEDDITGQFLASRLRKIDA